jgi:hypothetical protein
MKLALVFGAIAASARVVDSEAPIDRVIELIKGLKSGIIEDGEKEQKIYDKGACWCEDTTASTARAIDKQKDEIDQLNKNIIQFKGTLGVLGVDIKQVAKDIASNQKSQEDATALRNKEKSEYEQVKTETEVALDGTKQAIGVLKANFDSHQAKLDAQQDAIDAARASAEDIKGVRPADALVSMNEARTLSVVSGLKSALAKLPENSLTDEELSEIQSFVKDPLGKRSEAFLQTRNPHGNYAPASTQIFGILKNMADVFAQELVDREEQEKQAQTDYDALMQDKREEAASLKQTEVDKKLSLADNKENLANAEVNREETQEALNGNEVFFADTKAGCQQKAADWAERTRLRTEELGGITQALKTLASGEATFEASANTFVQYSLQNVRKEKALKTIKALAAKKHSLRLASLAVRVKMSGHFDEVIAEIDKMIAVLRQEAKDDVAHRDRCQNEMSALGAEGDSLADSKKRAETNKRRLADKKSNEEAEKTATETEIKDVEDQVTEALTTRNEEHDISKQARKDDAEGVALIKKARGQMAAFYENNKKLLLQQPEDVEAEPASLDANYGGRKSETTGVLAILDMLAEDIEKEMGEKQKAEKDAAAEFQEMRSAANKTLKALTAKKISLEQSIAALDQSIVGLNEDITGLEEQEAGNAESATARESDCAWVKSSFDTRKSDRETEIGQMQAAKASLLGAGYDSTADGDGTGAGSLSNADKLLAGGE